MLAGDALTKLRESLPGPIGRVRPGTAWLHQVPRQSKQLVDGPPQVLVLAGDALAEVFHNPPDLIDWVRPGEIRVETRLQRFTQKPLKVPP